MTAPPTRLDAVCEAVHGDFASCGATSLQELCQQVRRLRINVQRLASEQIPSLDVDITALQEPHLRVAMHTNVHAGVNGSMSTPGNAIVGAESLLSHCRNLTADFARGSHRMPDKQRLQTTIYAVGYTPHYHQKKLPLYKSTESPERYPIQQQTQNTAASLQPTNAKSSIQQKEPICSETTTQAPSNEEEITVQASFANKIHQTSPPAKPTRELKPPPFGQAATGDKPTPFGQAATGDKPLPFGQAATGDKPTVWTGCNG
ncbi:surface antigen 2 (CA-2) [Trypanosoma rangeli]|uniref:Surface antigen 2 (CA-2) n=1 Tax=Trypanosoma rangeli TaxID=5698 RepID=A0A422MQD8_TRYRA|nr:surface antigen 2 (CA-2) [Trypanosoma rangeli]RNE95468.1 surface antigen 2 (CA-2) [Trypanosoma rangeli]|eukprot:RNE95468.1 surface antigen 2 (CA-2) [Trypanosoma rangeli]